MKSARLFSLNDHIKQLLLYLLYKNLLTHPQGQIYKLKPFSDKLLTPQLLNLYY